ncbi:MAG TPA: helix-turn-helix domain-containing protein [Roseomonas sp.]|nr:helix-turn-helix domain-containing protein [Roseomonas sp.]
MPADILDDLGPWPDEEAWQGEEREPEAPWRRSRPPAAEPDPAALLQPLSAADDVLSRLDALAGAASPALREGLVARLAFAEASGWLVQEGVQVHPRDLALRANRLTGSYTAAAMLGRLERELPETWRDTPGPAGAVGAEHMIEQALALARLLQRLATLRTVDPLDDRQGFARALGSLGSSLWPAELQAAGAAPPDFGAWRRNWLGAERQEPALLAAARGAARWMQQAGAGDVASPGLQQALFLAAVLLRRRGRLHHVPLPFWSAGRVGRRPLRRPSGDPAGWPLAFLERVQAATLRALDELDRLEGLAEKAAQLAAGRRTSSSLAAAHDLALRLPVLTAGVLADKLDLTPQGALLVLNQLAKEGLVREATGRARFRAYVA